MVAGMEYEYVVGKRYRYNSNHSPVRIMRKTILSNVELALLNQTNKSNQSVMIAIFLHWLKNSSQKTTYIKISINVDTNVTANHTNINLFS